MTMTPNSFRNAVICGIGFLILGNTTQSVKIFFLTLACLIAAQAVVVIMLADDNCGTKQVGGGGGDDDDDDDDDEDVDPDPVPYNVRGGGETLKTMIEEVAKEDMTESYEMVEHDQTLLKTTKNGTIGGATGLATDGKIATTASTTGVVEKNPSASIVDESPKIIDFVEAYCDELIDAAVAEVMDEVVSRVVDVSADQDQECGDYSPPIKHSMKKIDSM